MTLNDANEGFAQSLAAMLPGGVLSDATAGYLEEPRGRFYSSGAILARPRSTDEVARIVSACAEARVGVIPYGGGTGLVGGQVMADGPRPLVLSLERMKAVRGVYPEENVLLIEAGATLSEAQNAAQEAGRLFPLSLASEGTARIGGCLSTNAGGVNVLRYGNARDLCLGLEAVLPDGSVWRGLKRLRKDNTGYDLKHLLMGAEGSLGVITAASLRLSPIPAGRGTAFFTVQDPAAALTLLALARDQLGDGVSAFELIHRQGLDFLAEVGPQLQAPFALTPEWMVLIDLGLPRGLDPVSALENLFEAALEQGLSDDGVIAQSEAQRLAFWAIRENIPVANKRIGSISSHDISVPLGLVAEFIGRANTAIAALGPFQVNCFGHLGDGNLHYNIFPPKGENRDDYRAQRDVVKSTVHELVHEFDGSISAEHGIGRLKVDDLNRFGDPVKLAAMRAIKSALDPHGIMNPGAVLRSA